MAGNDRIILDKILEERHVSIAGSLSPDEYFEIFTSEQILKDYAPSYEEIEAEVERLNKVVDIQKEDLMREREEGCAFHIQELKELTALCTAQTEALKPFSTFFDSFRKENLMPEVGKPGTLAGLCDEAKEVLQKVRGKSE